MILLRAVLISVIVSMGGSVIGADAERKRVVIIGAGASGISAATRLYENGIDDIVVLEAENRIGGRVNTLDVKNGFVEMGAEWIHGEKGNVVYGIASARNLARDAPSESYSELFVRSSGEVVEQQLANRLSKLSEDALLSDAKAAKAFKNCGEFFVHFLKDELNKSENADVPEDMKSEFIEFCHQHTNSYDASETWFHTSVSNLEEYEECGGNLHRMWNGTGYRILFDILMEKSQKLSNGSFKSNVIALNTEVTRISSNESSTGILVESSNGRLILADHVIVTLSLGALREIQAKLFDSTLLIPELKIRSINNLEFGTVDKIYLEFSKPWWPEDCVGFSLLWTKKDREEYMNKGLEWAVDMFAVNAANFAPNILCAWISGASARVMESLEETFVQKTVVEILRRFLSKKWDVPEADRIIRSTWYSNKHFRGSYSNRNLQTDAANVSALSLSLPVNDKKGTPVLLFAGEATSPHYYSTVHGAVESGWREADRIISIVKNS